jgi:UDP-3-O-[3-hydroxymyristoyl] N-acetylglucosamine deacetylase
VIRCSSRHVSHLNPLPSKQRSLATIATVSGFGYWSGRDVCVQFRPAAVGTGIVFFRSDMTPARRIPVCIERRVEVPRRTALAEGGASVEMVEHILAALHGLGIDNCEIHVDAAEMPGCDGSALPFVEALLSAGLVEQPAARRRLVVTEVTRVGNEDCWVEARPGKHGQLAIKYRLDYGSQSAIGRQTIELTVSPESFRQELAAARTFLLEEEAQWLRSRGLGTRVTNHDLLVYGPQGVIDNALRFEDECVRHKALDLVGDLALAGCEIVGHVTAFKSGHRLNAELVKVLLKEGRMEQGLRRTA